MFAPRIFPSRASRTTLLFSTRKLYFPHRLSVNRKLAAGPKWQLPVDTWIACCRWSPTTLPPSLRRGVGSGLILLTVNSGCHCQGCQPSGIFSRPLYNFHHDIGARASHAYPFCITSQPKTAMHYCRRASVTFTTQHVV